MLKMKTMRKAACLLLCLSLIAVFSPRPVSALHDYEGIDLSQLELYQIDKSVSVTIGDLTFKGGRLSQGVGDETLVRIAGETLKELGLTADEVKTGQKWIQYRDETTTEFKKILESYELENQIPNFVFGLAGLLPGPTGVIAGASGTIYSGETAEGASGVANTVLSAGGTVVSIFEQLPIIGGLIWLAQNILTGLDQQTSMEYAVVRLQQNMPYINKAMRFMRTFQNKVNDYISKNGAAVRISFENCIAERDFSFYGVGGNKSLWLLNLNLSQEDSTLGQQTGNVKLRGDFSVYEKTNFEGFAADPIAAVNNLPGIEGNIQKIIDQEGFKSGNVTAHSVVERLATNHAPWMERTISGKAEASYSGDVKTLSLYFEQGSDEKSINFAGSPSFGYTVWTEAPNVGKTMEKSAQFQFQCSYSGNGDPAELKLEGFGPQVWFNEIFYPATDPWFNMQREQVKADVKKQFDEYVGIYPWDKSVWEPWGEANPPATLLILG